MHRFFAPALDPGDDTVVLPREEAEHLTRVLRLSVGDTVNVFNGRGLEFLARVVSAARREVTVQLMSRVEAVAESHVAITLAQAVLKGDKMDDVVRDAVMLGVAAVQPIVTKRTETTVAALMRGARVDRWRRMALASAKQSGRAVLPEICTPLTLEDWLGDPRPVLTLMLVEPRIQLKLDRARAPVPADVESLAFLRDQPVPHAAAVLVGPEGGWSEAELDIANGHGVRLVTLGPRTLRADAVPIAALSVLQFLWEA